MRHFRGVNGWVLHREQGGENEACLWRWKGRQQEGLGVGYSSCSSPSAPPFPRTAVRELGRQNLR